jgi:hypothetical protein
MGERAGVMVQMSDGEKPDLIGNIKDKQRYR